MSKLLISLMIALVVTMPAVGVLAHDGCGGLGQSAVAKAQHDERVAAGTRSLLAAQRLLGSFQRCFFTPAGERAPVAAPGTATALVTVSVRRMPHTPVPAGDVVLRI